MPEARRVLTVVGDPNRIGDWSGTPYFFLKAGKAQGFLAAGLPLRPEDLRCRRLIWNLARRARGARPGGFQYTDAFLGPLFAKAGLCGHGEIEIVSHFPLLPPWPWPRAWRVSYYLDATLRQNFVDYGLARRIDGDRRQFHALQGRPRTRGPGDRTGATAGSLRGRSSQPPRSNETSSM